MQTPLERGTSLELVQSESTSYITTIDVLGDKDINVPGLAFVAQQGDVIKSEISFEGKYEVGSASNHVCLADLRLNITSNNTYRTVELWEGSYDRQWVTSDTNNDQTQYTVNGRGTWAMETAGPFQVDWELNFTDVFLDEHDFKGGQAKIELWRPLKIASVPNAQMKAQTDQRVWHVE